MLSSVNSSCSNKNSEPRADEDQLPLHEANQVVRFEAHTKNFSIRDHVLASRSKNICASWPFPRQLLQICLKNGIRDLLPPFEPPSSVRSAHCLVKPVAEVENISTRSHQLDESGEPVLKKCRLIQKPEELSEASLEEEIISSTSMASDIMALKVCPVCKTFSSTSNTTLNAHMDQCLSMESDATQAGGKNQKIKAIKPRKKRLLVDIYATTTVCTLEDLDRRNGTSWATELNTTALTVESNSDAKKSKLAESDTRDDKSEGAVYIDSNGIKIRILSNISDAPDVLTPEEFRPRKSIEVSDGMVTSLKDHFGASSSKKTKLKFRNKKLRSLKLFENEMQAEVSHHEEEEGLLVHLSGELEKGLTCGSATLKNWPSSKRSHLPKKSGKTDFHKILDHLKTASDVPPSKSHFGELSELLETRRVDFPSCIVQNMEVVEKSSRHSSEGTTTNAVLLKLPRVSESLDLSPRSTSEEFCKGIKKKSPTPKPHQRLAKTYHLLKETKNMSNLSTSKSRTTKMGKHRSLLAWTDEQRRYSNIQVDHEMGLGTLTGASSENIGAGSIMQKSLTDDYWDRMVASNDKTSVTMPIKPTPHQLENNGIESQAKAATVVEFGACITSHRMDLENTGKNFSITLNHLLPKQGNLVNGSELPISPASSTSTISLASPKGCHFKASEIKPVLNPLMIRENLNFPSPFMELKEGNKEMDIDTSQQVEKACCCSWQSIIAGDMKQKSLSNLYIRPSIPCFYANSNSRTESIAPSMESPTESILTKAFSDVGSTSPSCGTPTQSSSGSIFRLMGKDLMIMNNEESTQISKVHSPTVQGLPSPFGFASSYASAPNHDTFTFAVHNQSPPSIISLQERKLLPDFHQNMNLKACMTKEVGVIDDSCKVFAPRGTNTSSYTMFQRPISYFPPRTHLLPIDNGIPPSIQINHASPAPASHLPIPFVFQAPATHLNSPFHYPQSLR